LRAACRILQPHQEEQGESRGPGKEQPGTPAQLLFPVDKGFASQGRVRLSVWRRPVTVTLSPFVRWRRELVRFPKTTTWIQLVWVLAVPVALTVGVELLDHLVLGTSTVGVRRVQGTGPLDRDPPPPQPQRAARPSPPQVRPQQIERFVGSHGIDLLSEAILGKVAAVAHRREQGRGRIEACERQEEGLAALVASERREARIPRYSTPALTRVAVCPLFAPGGENQNGHDPNCLIPLEPTIGIEPMTC